MKYISLTAIAVLLACCWNSGQQALPPEQVTAGRPGLFPARIWAACDFELLRHDIVWGAKLITDNIPVYPANSSAASAREIAPGVQMLNVIFTRYPRVEDGSKVYFRYFLEKGDRLELRLYNLDRRAWHSVTLIGLTAGEWAEAAADFGAVDDGAGGGPLRAGERVSEVAFIVPGGGGLLVDDVICFAGGSMSDEAGEKFPRRVIALWGFDPLDYYHPWTHTDYRVNHEHGSLAHDWGAAEALESEGRGIKRIRMIVDPPQHVGEHTRARYSYYLENVLRVQPMIFDLTDEDNRHIGLEGLPQGEWRVQTLDFTRDGIRNDGNQTPFEAGSRVDDLFFLAWPADSSKPFIMLMDDFVLYDAYE